jgi:PIN domain nuclease of toxin-antitoxin system
MILFFDTSALVKLFNIEAGSDKVKELITKKYEFIRRRLHQVV